LTDAAAAPDNSERLDACFEAVRAACVARGIGVVRLESPPAGYLGVELTHAERAWKVYVDCTEEALALPHIFHFPATSLLAHVSYKGNLCVNDGQGLSLDPDRPAEVVAYTVLAGYDLLERSAADAASERTEFFNELEGYWCGLPDCLTGRVDFEVDGVARIVRGFADAKAARPKWYFIDVDGKPPRDVTDDKLQHYRALYVHLDAFPLPPVNPARLTTAFIREVCARMTPAQVELWAELLGPSKNAAKRLALLVSVPRQAGGRSLVGIEFGANRGNIDEKAPVTPLWAHRFATRYMRERGGASLQLAGKHVAVIGCGAVGSFVVDSLACAGVGKLTLVDNDDYSVDNVFRHVLRPMYVGFPKVYALKHQLDDRYPGVEVIPFKTTGQKWLRSADLSQYDGVVLALGAPSVERSFSRALKDDRYDLPVVFTWLEATDVGGHSVLMGSRGEGCLDCIYRDDEGQNSLASRNLFLEPNQPVTKNLTGCGGAFVPYGALQARRTGLLTAEQLLGAMTSDSAVQPSYRFWVGEGVLAAQHGLRTTPWFQAARATSADDATRQVFGLPCKRCRTPAEPAEGAGPAA
jgi:hypothetical protein